MTPSQLERRRALLARSDAALDRWPDREGREFVREMTEVAEGLKALAEEADRAGSNAIERARTWRHAGNACFDLGAGGRRPQLEAAAAAFRRAEALLGGENDPVETSKLNYSFGQTLMLLCDAKDVRLASEARARFATALRLARVHLPAGVPPAEKNLQDAERVVALLTQANRLGERIDHLKTELHVTEARPQPAHGPLPSLDAAGIQSLFGVLQQEFEKDKADLEPTRREGLSDFMGRLGKLVASEDEVRTLDDRQAMRGKLDSLMRELGAQAQKPSLKGPGAPAGSRSEKILAALQELKMFVGTASMQQGTPRGLREAAFELFPRIGRVTTWISEAGGDATKVRQLEMDQARGLANEVRLFARRAHLMLARPVWRRYSGLVEPNRIFFSGPSGLHDPIAAAAASLGLEAGLAAPAGADFAEHRWEDLRASNVAVFDLSESDPQVYYELGIALTLGTQLLLIAKEGTEVPFDVEQNVRYYRPMLDLRGFFADELDGALYGLSVREKSKAGLAMTLTYAERLAAADSGNALLGVALRSVRNAGSDPVQMHDALNTFNSYLGQREREILLPRWPADYPDPRAPRCFAVMPFREEQSRAYVTVAAAAEQAGVKPVRGDVAEGQQIIESIWEEICRATHVTADLSGLNLNVCLELGMAHTLGRPTRLIGSQGTERTLKARLPGVAKRRCFTYASDLLSTAAFRSELDRFFGKVQGA